MNVNTVVHSKPVATYFGCWCTALICQKNLSYWLCLRGMKYGSRHIKGQAIIAGGRVIVLYRIGY